MRYWAVTVLGVVLWGSALAQTGPAAADYSPDEFVKAILTGPQPCPPGKSLDACEANPKTRRFSLAAPNRAGATAPVRGDVHGANGLRVEPGAVAKARRVTAADILVTFAVGSADLTPSGQANLKSVAVGLNRPALAPLRFEVAGYTDVTGAPGFNADLSRRRAEAVKTYLASLSVDPNRLSAVGYGSEHLADPEDPTAETNRRVELHRLN